MIKSKTSRGEYVVCVDSTNDDIDLIVGKLYKVAKPQRNDPPHMLRIVDESGEDYLYPADWFISMEVPPKVKRALAAGSS
jgi:hypothetical protein